MRGTNRRPGPAQKDRFEGRDLRITTDLRGALHPLLVGHLQVLRYGRLDLQR